MSFSDNFENKGKLVCYINCISCMLKYFFSINFECYVKLYIVSQIYRGYYYINIILCSP